MQVRQLESVSTEAKAAEVVVAELEDVSRASSMPATTFKEVTVASTASVVSEEMSEVSTMEAPVASTASTPPLAMEEEEEEEEGGSLAALASASISDPHFVTVPTYPPSQVPAPLASLPGTIPDNRI